MWRQVVAQSPGENAPAGEILRYDVGWKALNTLLKSGRSLSGHERNCCFLNTRGGRFADISASAGIDFDDDGRILAVVDWDLDGDQDFWIANRTGPQVRFLRNDAANDHGFVDFMLEGVTCNRDAIGARVEILLEGEDQPRFQTVRAGEGYLAQSSRWVHFGLGKAAAISKVTVRWPDGTVEAFDQVEPNHKYTIKQNSGRVQIVAPRQLPQELQPAPIEVPPSTEQSRIVLIAPVPIPEMNFETPTGSVESIAPKNSGRPRLINLWATWCQPCVYELAEWAEHRDELAAAGLDILALNVDEPEENRAAQQRKIEQFADELELPFPRGFGTEELVIQFDVVQRSILRRQKPLPVPSSFLVDGEGNLRIIYKGPVKVEQLLADAKLVDASPEEIMAASVPYPGKWLGQPAGTSPNTVAVKFVEGGFNNQTIRFLERLNRTELNNPTFNRAESNALLGALYLDAGMLQESAAAFQAALALDPNHRQSHIELAGVLAQLRDFKQAAHHYRQALVHRGNDPELRMKLALALNSMGAAEEAIQEFQESAALRPSALTYHHLGNTFMGLGQTAQAIEAYNQAMKLNPNFLPSRNNLAWVLATTASDDLRDGARAVEIAEAINAAAAQPSAGNFDTLAAAYAEAGQFEDAIRAVQSAIAMAEESGDAAKAQRMKGRLELYQSGNAYRELP